MEQNSPFTLDEFNDVLDQELSVFKANESYDYVRDMKDAYSESLSKSAAHRIFETLPDHVFWDIKKPQVPEEQKHMNPYNPFRKYPYSTFFEMRDFEEFMDRRHKKPNLRDNISLYRRY